MVTIVILTTGKAEKVIECLSNQTYQDFEIILAQEKGCMIALNKALDRARGSIFVRVDDDVYLPPGWLEQLIKPFSDPMVAGVTGPTFVSKQRRAYRDSIRWAEKPHWFLNWLYDNGEFKPAGIRKCGCVSYDSNFEERFEGYTEKDFEDYEPDHLEGTNWAMRTWLIRKVGGFDPKFDGVSEWIDDDVVFKVKRLGYKLRYNPNAIMHHLLEMGEHHSARFEGFGRIKNFLRFHIRHGKFHYKMLVYLGLWSAYFLYRGVRK